MKIKSYLEKSPVFRIINSAVAVEKMINEDLNALEISYFQSLILISIFAEESDVYSKDLAAHFPITKGAISQGISILEAKRLLKRITTKDKRLMKLQLTEKGSRTAVQLIGILEMAERKFEAIVSLELIQKLPF